MRSHSHPTRNRRRRLSLGLALALLMGLILGLLQPELIRGSAPDADEVEAADDTDTRDLGDRGPADSKEQTEQLEEAMEQTPYPSVKQQPRTWDKELIESVENLGLITGDASPNETRRRFSVGGTDLGIPVLFRDTLYLFFGDSFLGDDQGHPMEGGAWRSNLAGRAKVQDFSQGLRFDDFIAAGENGIYAKELIPSKKIPGEEHTVIPTGGVESNDALYVYFMSVRSWGEPGQWTINYGGLAKSTDGENFEKLDFQLDGERFGQVAAIERDGWIYGLGLGGGRFGSVHLFRVRPETIEDAGSYEYYSGQDAEDQARYSPELSEAVPVLEGPAGELSVFYDAYLGEYVLTYLNETKRAIVMRRAEALEGPWSEESVLVHGSDYPALYGGFTHEVMAEDDGRIFYFTLSMWDPIYNVLWMKVTLK